jgi:uncharacterized OB-fold protein
MQSTTESDQVLTKTNPFLFTIEGEEAGPPGLKASGCRACSRFTLGRVQICAQCFSREVGPAVAGQRATLVEYSIAHYPAGGFDAPYAIGLVRTEEGITLFAPIHGDVERLRAGDKLAFVTVPRPGGMVGFAYAPREDVISS